MNDWGDLDKTPEARRRANLTARAKAKPTLKPFIPDRLHTCGLCDRQDCVVLLPVRKFDNSGNVLGCSSCVRELLGHTETVT